MPQLDIDRSCVVFYAACLLAFLSVQCHLTSHYVCPLLYHCRKLATSRNPPSPLPTSPHLSSFQPPSPLLLAPLILAPLLSSPLIFQLSSFYSILLSYLTLPFYTLTRQHLPFIRATWHDKKCCIAPFDVIQSAEALFVNFNHNATRTLLLKKGDEFIY